MEKMRRLLIFIICVIIFGLNSCSSEKVITHNKILGEADSYSYLNKDLTINEAHLKLKYKRFTGVDTLWKLQSESDSSIKITYDSAIDKGKINFLLITPDKKIINIFEESENDEYVTDIKKGEYKIKIVGTVTATGILEADLIVNEDINVTYYDN